MPITYGDMMYLMNDIKNDIQFHLLQPDMAIFSHLTLFSYSWMFFL